MHDRKRVASERTVPYEADDLARPATAEDADDLAAFDGRRLEEALPFTSCVDEMKRRGRL